MKSLVFATVLLAACASVPPGPQTSSSSAGVHFAAERLSSDAVRLMLDNGAAGRIGYNLCSSELQRRDGDQWIRVDTGDICTMQLMTLNAGHDATFEKRLPSTLSPGEYRYVTSIENPIGSPMTRLATAPFSR